MARKPEIYNLRPFDRRACVTLAFSISIIALQISPAQAREQRHLPQVVKEQLAPTELKPKLSAENDVIGESNRPHQIHAQSIGEANTGSAPLNKGLASWSKKYGFAHDGAKSDEALTNERSRRDGNSSNVKTEGKKTIIVKKSTEFRFSELKSVLYVPPTAPLAHQLEEVLRMSDGCAVGKIAEATIGLNGGNVILHPTGNLIIETPHGVLSIADKSVVLIEVDCDKTNVLNLHDQKLHSVKAVSGMRTIDLNPGQGAAFGKRGNFEKELSRDGLARRNVCLQDCQDGLAVVSYEFSFVQVHAARELLADLARSENHKERKLMNEVIKTAAALSLVTASHGAYHSN
jgi:hypothetical protein